MKSNIKNIIYQSIIENKWLDISYANKKNEITNFYIGINSLDIDKGLIYCAIFNQFKSYDTIDDKKASISISGIKKASIIENSYYDTPKELIDLVNHDKKLYEYLEIVNYDNNILKYLSDCYKLDNDPFLKDTITIDGIDTHTLLASDKYKLDNNQFKDIINKVFKKNKEESENKNRYQTLAINKFSIDINNKQFVVAYRTLSLNFKDRTLKISDKTSINKSFLIDLEKLSLNMYLNMDVDIFCNTYDEKEKEYIELIKENFIHGERVNTRPFIFFLAREFQLGVEEAFESIYQMDKENKLTFPLKSFFGRNKSRGSKGKDTNIVVFDKSKVNIDQLRVIYNSMVNHVTYVKGPPGTGKTETIFNVLLSAYVNNKTALVCSNNNHPINDIYSKMDNFLKFKKSYNSKEEKVLFPMLRIGSNEKIRDITLPRLKEVLYFVNNHLDIKVQDKLTEESKSRLLSNFNKLRDSLNDYEFSIEIKERIERYNKIKKLAKLDILIEKIDNIINELNDKLNNIKNISPDEILNYAISISENRNFQNYIYYSSLIRYKRLLTDQYKELRNIINSNNIEEAVLSFNKYIKDDTNFKKLLAVFPLIICTNLSSSKLGLSKPSFNLVIMDEAAQCNIASSLIPIIRGNDLLLVGDTNQLQPVTVLEENTNELLRNKYQINEEYDYIHNSILSLMVRKDNNSKNILLRYHYRCGKKIASFINDRFYNHQLEILNKKDGNLKYYNVINTPTDKRNAYLEEAKQVVKIIKENNYSDVGIIAPFVNQALLINKLLAENGIKNIKAGTIHTHQGSEKEVIILSSAISLKTARRTLDWIKNNHELINVAVTRAKNSLIFVGDKKAIDILSNNERSDLKVLSDYISKDGLIDVPKSDNIISYDYSNNSINEKEFFDTITPYFNRRGTKFRIDHNVHIKQAIKNIYDEDLKLIGKKEFDIIVQLLDSSIYNQYRTIVVFEIDGGEHIGNNLTIKLDRQKEEICKKYKIKLIRIPNSGVKDYESIIELFEYVTSDLKSIDDTSNQLKLFEDE